MTAPEPADGTPEPPGGLQMVAGDDAVVCEDGACYVLPSDTGARGLRR